MADARKIADNWCDTFMANFKAGNAAGCGQLYVEDCTVMAEADIPIKGRAAVTDVFRGNFDGGATAFELNTHDVINGVDFICLRGMYRLLDAKDMVTERGKYMTLLRKVGDQWLAHWDMWNKNADNLEYRRN